MNFGTWLASELALKATIAIPRKVQSPDEAELRFCFKMIEPCFKIIYVKLSLL